MSFSLFSFTKKKHEDKDNYACEAAITILQNNSKVSTSDINWGLQAISVLCEDNDDAFTRFSEAGMCDAVVDVLKINIDHDNIVCPALDAMIALLTCGKEICYANQEAFGKAGSCSIMLEAMHIYLDNAEIMGRVCLAIDRLCCMNATNQNNFRVEGVCNVLMSSVLKHYSTQDSTVLINGCNALTSLCRSNVDNIENSFGEAGACEIIFSWIMNVARESPEIAIYGWTALGTLAETEANRKRIEEIGVCEELINCMRSKALTVEYSLCYCSVIAALSKNEENSLKLGNSGACEILSDCLKEFIDSATTIEYVTFAIGNLALIATHKLWFGETGTCEFLLKRVLSVHSSKIDIVRNTCRAIANLCHENQINCHHFKSVYNGYKNIVNAVDQHNFDPDIVEWTCKIALHLSIDIENVELLGKSKLIQSLMLMITEHHSNIAMNKFCLSALNILFNCDTNIMIANSLDSHTTILNCTLRHGTDLEISKIGCGLLGRISFSNHGESSAVLGSNLESLSSILLLHIRESSIVQGCCRAVCNIGTFTESSVINLGAAVTIIDAIQKSIVIHNKCPDTVIACMDAVTKLATSADNRNQLGRAGLCQTIVDVLSNHESSEVLAATACRCLSKLATKNEENIHRLRQCRGCEAIVSAILLHFSSHIVAKWGCVAVTAMSTSDENKKRLREAGACVALVRVLNKNLESDDICEHALLSVAVLANDCHENAVKLGSLNACAAIVTALERHSSNSAVCVSGCNAIDALAPTQHKYFDGPGISALLVGILTIHNRNDEATTWACRAIASLCTDPSIKMNLGVNGACSAVITTLGMLSEVDLATAMMNWQNVIGEDSDGGGGCNSGAILSSLSAPFNRAKSTIVQTVAICAGQSLADRLVDTFFTNQSESQKEAVRCCFAAVTALVMDSKENLSHVVEISGCEIVLRALQKFIKTVNVALEGCKSLYCICLGHQELRGRLGDIGACKTVAQILQTHLNDIRVAEWASKAMLALADSNTTNILLFVNFRVIELISTAMSVHYENQNVTIAGLDVISTLSAPTDIPDVVNQESGICEAVVSSLRATFADETIVRKSVQAMIYISRHPAKAVRLGNVGACEMILQVLKKYSGNPTVTALSLDAIGNLAISVENSARLGQLDACVEIMNQVRQYSRNCHLLQKGMRALGHLSICQENRIRLKVVCACDVVVDAMKRHADNEALVDQALRAITELARYHSENVPSIRSTVTEMLFKYMCNPVIVVEGCKAITVLSDRAAFDFELADIQRISEVVVVVMQRFLKSEAVIQHVSQTTATLAGQHQRNRECLGDKGICDTLVKALSEHSRDAAIVMSLCQAVTNVSLRDNKNCLKFMAGGVNAVLFECIECHAANPALIEQMLLTVHTLSKSKPTRGMLGNAGWCLAVITALQIHMKRYEICLVACRTVSSLAEGNSENQMFFHNANAVQVIKTAAQMHAHHKKDKENKDLVDEAWKALQSIRFEGEVEELCPSEDPIDSSQALHVPVAKPTFTLNSIAQFAAKGFR